jgi:type IV pilus assembly protein PilV
MLIRRQRGLTLIESMVALMVISIGLLGIASLQGTSMRQTASSLNHSKAVWFAYDMADRIRVNTAGAANYAGIDTETEYQQDCKSAACSAAQMVTADAAAWSRNLQGLPAGRGMIVGNASRLILTVMWDDESTGARGTDCGPDPEVDLTCYRITLLP